MSQTKQQNETITEKEWTHSGLSCKVNFYKMSGYNWRCGYVGLPKGHPCFEFSYDDIPVDVHGGLTFSELGKSGVYWVGFDCNHAGDRTEFETTREGHFWLTEDVIKETNRLAEQLSKVTIKDCVDYKLRYMPEWFKTHVAYVEVSNYKMENK